LSSSAPPAAQGLKLDLKLLDGNQVELSGDVVVTTDGMAVTPSGMGFTPMNGPSVGALVSADDDWFATYSASNGHPAPSSAPGVVPSSVAHEGGSAPGSRRPEEVQGLSPLLTPSNSKLCAAIVDAY